MNKSFSFKFKKGDSIARHSSFEKFSAHGCVVGPKPLGLRGGRCFGYVDGEVVFYSKSKGAREIANAVAEFSKTAGEIVVALGKPIEIRCSWQAMTRPESYMVEWRELRSKTWHPMTIEDPEGYVGAYLAKKQLAQLLRKLSADKRLENARRSNSSIRSTCL